MKDFFASDKDAVSAETVIRTFAWDHWTAAVAAADKMCAAGIPLTHESDTNAGRSTAAGDVKVPKVAKVIIIYSSTRNGKIQTTDTDTYIENGDYR